MLNSFDMGSKEHLATPKIEITEVKVDVLQHPENIKLLTSEMVLNYESLVQSRGGNFDVTQNELFRFFITAIYHRVLYVNGNSKHQYKKFIQYEAHPHTLGVIIANLGKAFDDQTGIDLTPVLIDNQEIEGIKLIDFILDESDYLNIVRKIRNLRQYGISVGNELPADKKGDFMTMSFACIEGHTKREDNRAHPTQALIAMISGINLAQSIMVPRITYISKDRVNTLIRSAAQFELPKAN